MKKLFILLMLIALSAPVFAVEKGVQKGYISRFGNWLDSKQTCSCPPCAASERAVCPNTPYDEIKRSPFELQLSLDLFESPAGGRPQFHASNWSAGLIHNLSPVFYLYGAYSSRSVDKIDYEGSVYDKTWSYQTFLAGAGFYLRPTIKIFGGIGKVIPKNAEGSEELSWAIERGIAWDIPLNVGYKLTIGFRSIDAGLADEDAHIAASLADASTNILFIALALPLGVFPGGD